VASNRRRSLIDDRAAGLTTVPAEAMRFDAGPFKFEAGNSKDGNRPISMLARTGKPIDHWYWGKVVHDMAGMALAAPTLPIDYCHDPEEVLGFLDKFDASNEGLMVSGDLVTFQPDDRTAEICHKADAGVPYQASIAFDPSSYVCEDVGRGMQVTVNGYQLEGPALVIRKWTLIAVSVCPYGADSGTRTNLSAATASDVPIQFVAPHKDPAAMSATPATDTKNETAKPATELTATSPATAPPAVDPRAEFKATLAKFTAKFGAANGAAWAAEGLSYEQGLEKHAEALASQLSMSESGKKELETKLAAIPRGEAEPVTFTTTDKHVAGGGTQPAMPTQYSHLGNLGKFAASIAGKLPK
jgi:hypothetical protein